MTFVWTFGTGYQCDDVPEVKSVKLVIPGESLDNNGFYACNTAGTDGIYPPGLVVGRITELDKQGAGMFHSARVALAVDTSRLEEVLVVPVPALDKPQGPEGQER